MTPSSNRLARTCAPASSFKIAAGVWTLSLPLIGAAVFTPTRPAHAVPAFAQQTGLPCKSCHVGGFGPELTPHGREFKLSGYTMRETEDKGSTQAKSSTPDQPSPHDQTTTPNSSPAQSEPSAQGKKSVQDTKAIANQRSTPCQAATPGQKPTDGEPSKQAEKPTRAQATPDGQKPLDDQTSAQAQTPQAKVECQSNPGKESKKGPPVPVAAMVITSFTHTRRDQIPAPEHLGSNDNLVLDQASLFLAGGIGDHFGGFAQITYDGVARHLSWDNLDFRAISEGHVISQDDIFGLSFNNNPTVQDVWNTLPAWGFPFTDTAVSPTPSAAPLIDGVLAQNVVGLTGYGWIAHKFYVEVGGYSSPSSGILRTLGTDPKDPGSIHGLAPYARAAYQTQLAGGTFEAGANLLKASIFPRRDRSSGFTDHYADWGLDSSWQKSIGKNDTLSANLRYEHERADLRASCALSLLGSVTDAGCARYHLNELRAALRYTLHDKLGLVLSPFSLTGSRNPNAFESGSPNSSGLMGEVDYTFWPDSKGPLGPLFNIRIGAQYTAYRKFDGRTSGAAANNALRLFAWIAF